MGTLSDFLTKLSYQFNNNIAMDMANELADLRHEEKEMEITDNIVLNLSKNEVSKDHDDVKDISISYEVKNNNLCTNLLEKYEKVVINSYFQDMKEIGIIDNNTQIIY